MKWKPVVLAAALAASLCSPVTSTVAAADAGWNDIPRAFNRYGASLTSCLEQARRERPAAWVCVGDELQTDVAVPDASPLAVSTVDTSLLSSPVALAAGDDYDTWCEFGSAQCSRRISPYIAEVKGNAVYGNASGAVGEFDEILRQDFNGPSPRWRLTLIWEWGASISPQMFTISCRRVVAYLPDAMCGQVGAYPLNISSASRRTSFPSATGYVQNPSPLGTASSKYHDEVYGQFIAGGLLITAATLHTGRWTNCPDCSYYQVPWTSQP